MLEVLVLTMCLQGYECTQMSKAYLQYNHEFRVGVKTGTKKAVKYMGRESALFVAISYSAFIKQELRVKLPYNFVVKWDFDRDSIDKNVNMNWRYDF